VTVATVRFVAPGTAAADKVAEVEAGESLLEAAERVGALVGSSCGGQCACSTCHVYVMQGGGALSAMADDEDDRLDMAFDVREESRLGCQARVTAGGEGATVVVHIAPESVKAWYDEHPAERARAEAGDGG